MSQTATAPEPAAFLGQPRLRPLDPDLPLLAAQAAIELDALRLSKYTEMTAFKELRSMLKNSFFENAGADRRKSLIDPGAESLLSYSLTASEWSGSVTQQELVEEAWKLVGKMETAEQVDDKKVIEKIRDFCVALSGCAASYRETIQGTTPVPPYRR